MGIYPYPEENTCIGMAQTILEADSPTPPVGSSLEFVDFITQCLHKEPSKRLPAEILLAAPWLQRRGAVSRRSSVAALKVWIDGGGGSLMGGGREDEALMKLMRQGRVV